VKFRAHLTALIATGSLTLVPLAVAADLTITVNGFHDTKGELLLSVVDSEAGWNNQAKPVAQQKLVVAQKVANDKSIKVTLSLPAGRYAVQVMHDANSNGKLDTNFLGIPSEGYGYSNNPVVRRRAYYSETAFDLPDAPTAIVVQLR
jgi:uncharacterized protein (DUF2141 family)